MDMNTIVSNLVKSYEEKHCGITIELDMCADDSPRDNYLAIYQIRKVFNQERYYVQSIEGVLSPYQEQKKYDLKTRNTKRYCLTKSFLKLFLEKELDGFCVESIYIYLDDWNQKNRDDCFSIDEYFFETGSSAECRESLLMMIFESADSCI